MALRNGSKITRRTLLASTAAVSALAAVCFSSALKVRRPKFVYKLANNLPTNHPINVRLREVTATIEEQTAGHLKIQIFPSSQLGSDTYLLNQIRVGGIEFLALSGMILGTLVPVAGISSVGFAFRDYPTVWRAMDGDLGAQIRRRIAEVNLIAMDKIFDNGFRQTTSSIRPIDVLEDYSGFKIRVPIAPLSISMFKALGASPSPMNFNELYSALQMKIVDGQENPLAMISAAKIYEVQKYCSLTNHMWDGYWVLADRRAWETLPEDLRTIVARNFATASKKARTDTERLNASLASDLANRGLIFNRPAIGSFREKLRQSGYYDEWKGQYGEVWTALEKYSGKLT